MSYKNWVVVEFWKLWETILNHLSLQSKSCNFFAQHGYEKVIDLGFFWKITYIVILLGLGLVMNICNFKIITYEARASVNFHQYVFSYPWYLCYEIFELCVWVLLLSKLKLQFNDQLRKTNSIWWSREIWNLFFQ